MRSVKNSSQTSQKTNSQTSQANSSQKRSNNSGVWPKSAAERLQRLNRSVALAEQHHLTGAAVFHDAEEWCGQPVASFVVHDPATKSRRPQLVSLHKSGEVRCTCNTEGRWHGQCRHIGALPPFILRRLRAALEARAAWERQLVPLRERVEREQREQQQREAFLAERLPGYALYSPASDMPTLCVRALKD